MQWIDPNDKTQKQYLPHIGEKCIFAHGGKRYFGHHTGGSFQTGAGATKKNFDTWECVWMPLPEAPNAKSQATDAALSRQVACTDGLGLIGSERATE